MWYFLNSGILKDFSMHIKYIHTYIYDKEGEFNFVAVHFSPSMDVITWCITVGTKPPNSNSVMRMPFMCTSEGVSFSHSCF